MLINSFSFLSSILWCNLNSAAPILVHGSYLYTIQAACQLSEHNQSIKPQSEVTAQPKNARLQFIRKSGKSTLIFLCPLRRLHQHFPSSLHAPRNPFSSSKVLVSISVAKHFQSRFPIPYAKQKCRNSTLSALTTMAA